MNFKWTLYEFQMGPVLLLIGPCMNLEWTLYDFEMDPVWVSKGPCITFGWTQKSHNITDKQSHILTNKLETIFFMKAAKKKFHSLLENWITFQGCEGVKAFHILIYCNIFNSRELIYFWCKQSLQGVRKSIDDFGQSYL